MLTSKNKNMVEIIESLIILGHQDAAQQIQDASETCNSEMDALALALKTLSVEKINERTNRLIKRAKIQKPKYFSRLINIPERKLDLDYLAELESLDFIKDGHNLVVWGSPGTGKSWMLDAIATKACEQGLKTRTMTFPALYRELDPLFFTAITCVGRQNHESNSTYFAPICAAFASSSMDSTTSVALHLLVRLADIWSSVIPSVGLAS